ncbi:MAG TPA: putative Ig domain-containing protein, partial [Pseudoxanthomonas sp.]
TITPATLPDGITHIAYSQSLTTSGGIAPYSYSIVSGNLPIGVSFSSAGVFSGTPTTAGSYTMSVRSTDDAGYNTTVSYTINVTSPSIVIDPPTLDAAIVGDAYTATLTASGGVAPYSYSLQSGALPPGVSFNSAGALAGTPTMSGSYTFGVRATDSNGNSGIRTYTLVVDPRTLALTPASLTSATAGTAYSATFSASGGIGAYHYVVSAGALPAGLNLDGNSGVLSGTPTTSGAFSFAITANDSGAGTPGTVTATYNLVVASPTLALTPAALSAGTGGVAYSQTLTASGGIAPYSYAVTTGSLPAGLSLTAAGLLSGTPTVAGSFAFSVTATDSTAGVAGTVVHNYTLVLAAPAIVIGPATVPNGMRGVAYSQTLAASGGTAGYTFAVTAGALPTGLNLSAAGVLSGTPTVAASNTFTVTATDALGFSASQGYTQAIAETVPVAHADAATTLGAAAATVAVTANDTGLIDSIAISTAPLHGSVVVTGLTAVYTAAANYSGTDTFAYTATGPGGTSAPALVTVTVNPVAMAVSRTVAAVAGMPVTVDLTQGATGGPFTAATLVALNPSTSGTVTIAQIGAGASAVYRLTYTPVSSYSGAATASFTLSNAFSTSAQAAITFDVAPRPDPSQDAEVRGLLNAQVASTRRFASSQINNFQQRLERLHGGNERNGFDNGLSVATDRRCEQKVGAIPGRTCDRNSPGAEFDGGNGPAGSGLHNDPANALGNSSASGPAFGAWAGGMIRSGNQDGRNGSATVDFETDGVSFGADYRFNDVFVFGAGVGYGRDDSDIGEHGSRSEGDAFTLAAYASYSPGDRFFLDGLVGYQQLNYDLRRYVTVNANTVAGSRDGDQWFASVSAGADIQNGDWQLTPYARVDVAQATLDGYTETGDPLYALAYGDLDVDTTTGNLGVRVDYRVRTGWGVFSPQLRLEYQHDFQGNGAAAMQYADFLTGPVYRAELDDFDRNRVNVGLGGLLGFDRWSLRLEYRGLIGSGGDSDHGVLLNIEKRL